MNNSSTFIKSSGTGSGSNTSSSTKTKVLSSKYCNDHELPRDHYDITGSKHNLFCVKHLSSTDIQLKPSNFKRIWPELLELYDIKSFKFQSLYGPVFNAFSNEEEPRQISLYVISSDSLDDGKRKNLEKIAMNKTYFQNKNDNFLEIYEIKTIKVKVEVEVEEKPAVKTLHLIEYENFMCLKRFLQKNKHERNEKMDIFKRIFEEVASLHNGNIYNIGLGPENIAIMSPSEAKFYPKISCINGLINDGYGKIPQSKQNDLAELGKLLHMMMTDNEGEKLCLDKSLPGIINDIIKLLCSGDKTNQVAQIEKMFELFDEETQGRTTLVKLNKK